MVHQTAMNHQHVFALVIDDQYCTAWRYESDGKNWQQTWIDLDERWEHSNDPELFPKALDGVAKNLADGVLQQGVLHVFFDAAMSPLMAEAPEILEGLKIPCWQLLSLQLWKKRAERNGIKVNETDAKWPLHSLLPLLSQDWISVAASKTECPAKLLDSEDSTPKQPAVDGGGHLSDMQKKNEQLTAQNQQYQQQIQFLNAELEQRQHSPQRAREQLLSFLPVIFKNFWQQMSPQTVATLMGTVEVPQISSPFIQPDEPTVLAKKRQFERLPSAEQQVIWSFCAQLNYHHLDMHPQFQSAFRLWQEQQP